MTKPKADAIHLPKLDRDTIRAEEQADVARRLDLWADAESRLIRAAEIADKAQAEFDRLRPERDAAALSLSLYDGARAVNAALGVTRTRWYEVRCDALGLTTKERESGWLKDADRKQVAARARRKRVPTVPYAVDTLPDLAERTARAEERAKAARVHRDQAAVDLLSAGWTRPQVAEKIGRNPSRISHIKSAAEKAAQEAKA